VSPVQDLVYEDEDGGEPEGGGTFELEAMRLHVMADRCRTCVFRPGDLMHLGPGRLREIVEANMAAEAALTCHSTLLYGQESRLPPAICNGYARHPAARLRSLGLRLARSLHLFTYHLPPREEFPVLLSERIKATGLTMSTREGGIETKSTGWTYRRWEVAYHLDDRRFLTVFEFGDVHEDPEVVQCLDDTLSVAGRVANNAGYEGWAADFAGDDPADWETREVYQQQVEHTNRLTEFLGGREELLDWLRLAGPNSHEAQDAEEHVDPLL
jgi:hypothetical protein